MEAERMEFFLVKNAEKVFSPFFVCGGKVFVDERKRKKKMKR
jgi:hypothetical protein